MTDSRRTLSFSLLQLLTCVTIISLLLVVYKYNRRWRVMITLQGRLPTTSPMPFSSDGKAILTVNGSGRYFVTMLQEESQVPLYGPNEEHISFATFACMGRLVCVTESPEGPNIIVHDHYSNRHNPHYLKIAPTEEPRLVDVDQNQQYVALIVKTHTAAPESMKTAVRVVDLTSGDSIHEIEVPNFVDSTDDILLLSTEKKLLASEVWDQRKTVVFSLEDGTRFSLSSWSPGHHVFSRRRRLSANYLLLSDRNEAAVWSTRSSLIICTVSDHTEEVECGGFSSKESEFVTGAWDSTARVWDVRSGHLKGVLEHSLPRISMAEFSTTGNFILTVSRPRPGLNAREELSPTNSAFGTASLWDAREFVRLDEIDTDIWFASFLTDEDLILTSDETSTRIWRRHFPYGGWGHLVRAEVWALIVLVSLALVRICRRSTGLCRQRKRARLTVGAHDLVTEGNEPERHPRR